MRTLISFQLQHKANAFHQTHQIWVWDLNTPEKPYSPGNRSRNLSDITSLAWNRKVSHILASSSTSGYTVVWDLKGRREVVALNYAAPQAMNPGQPWMGGPQQPRAGLSAVSWHPENVRRLLTFGGGLQAFPKD